MSEVTQLKTDRAEVQNKNNSLHKTKENSNFQVELDTIKAWFH